MTTPHLPVIQQTPDSGACCAACAARPAPVQRPRSRADDRRITLAGLAVSAAILGVALASVVLPESVRRGLWLPLHLGLAGAAGTAVASVLPFFTAALAVAPPAGRAVRIMAIAFVALGSLTVSAGVVGGVPSIAVAGGLTYLGGLGALAVAAFGNIPGSLGPKRLLLRMAYGAALAQVAVGVVMATAMLAGFTPIVERWGLLKPAHAWLNVFGFLSVIVAATLVHLAPTVAGTRIRARSSAVVAVVGLVVGAPVIAIGFALGDDTVVRTGAFVEVLGAGALVGHGIAVQRGHGRWTTDPGWHRLTSWSLLAAPIWLLVATLIGGGRLIWLGAVPAAWSLGDVAAPLALGWVAQVLIGAWSHLLPAIGPGDGVAHARARDMLGRGARVRVVGLNLGVALLVAGASLAWSPAVVIGLALAVGSSLASVVTFLLAATHRRSDALVPSASA